MIGTTSTVDLDDFIASGKQLVANANAVVDVAKDGKHLFYYTHYSNLHTVVKDFLKNIKNIESEPETTVVKEPKRIKIEVASQIDGRELTQAEQTLLKVRERFNFFKNMNDSEVLSVTRDIGMMRLNKGEILFRQGSVGDQVFFIVRGVVSIQISKSQTSRMEVAKLHSGAIFGEMSPVTREKRSATVICVEDGTTLLNFRLSEDLEESTAMAYAKMYHNFTFILADKIVNQNKILISSDNAR